MTARASLTVIATMVLALLLAGEASAQASDAFDNFLETSETDRAAAQLIGDIWSYDVEGRIAELGEQAAAGSASAATDLAAAKKTKSLLDKGGILADAVEEIPEVLRGFEEEGLAGGLIEGAGAVANTATDVLLGGGNVGMAVRCAAVGAGLGGPIGAVLGFGGCYLIGDTVVGLVADKAEQIVEDGLRQALGRPPEPLREKGGWGRGRRMVGDILISVFVDGAIVTRASGAGSKAQADIGVAKEGGTEVVVGVDGSVTTIAEGRSTARTEIGVATGRGAEVIVNVDGSISTIARGASDAVTQIGIASGERSSAIVHIDGDVVTNATGASDASTRVGIASGHGAEVMVNVDGDILTNATGAASATTDIGGAHGAGSRARVSVDGDVTSAASGRASANTSIGVTNSGDVSVFVGDDVTTIGTGMGHAETEIGTGSGGTVGIGGSVMTQNAARPSATTAIGRDGSAFVGGDVLNFGGDVTIGGAGACERTRDGQCCLTLYMNRCVTQITPSYKGACPPRFIPVMGRCYFIPDTHHSIGR